MDFIIDAIVEWLKGLLVDGIMGNLDGLFDNVNQSVGEIATQVGTTPADWNAGVVLPSFVSALSGILDFAQSHKELFAFACILTSCIIQFVSYHIAVIFYRKQR